MAHLTDEQRECLNRMCKHGGMNLTVLRAAVVYLEWLETENQRLLDEKNDAVRQLHAKEQIADADAEIEQHGAELEVRNKAGCRRTDGKI